MATLSNMSQHIHLKFKPLDAHSSSSRSCGYTWEYSGTADAKVGPDQKEIDELRRGDLDDSANRDKYLNQCLFVRTLNVTLNDDDWEHLNQEIVIGYTPNSITKHGTGTPSISPRERPLPPIPHATASTTGNFGTQRTTGEFISLGLTVNRLTISVPPTATVRVFQIGVI
jgi:hypothetical protein